MSGYRRRRPNAVPCAVVREHLSAALDGEERGGPWPGMPEHLEACGACREFEERAAALTRQLRVRLLEEVPDLTGDILERVLAEATYGTSTRPAHHWPIASSAGLTRWALAIIPLGLALSSLASGAFSKPHIVPSHPVTPCTVSLVRDRAHLR